MVSVSWNGYERLLNVELFVCHFHWYKFILSVKTTFLFYMDKVACIKFLWQCNWVFLTLWSALSFIIPFTFYFNFTPTVIAFWFGIAFPNLVATWLNFGKGQILFHGRWGGGAACSSLSESEMSNSYAVTNHWQTLKWMCWSLTAVCVGYVHSDLRPEAANGSVNARNLKFV